MGRVEADMRVLLTLCLCLFLAPPGLAADEEGDEGARPPAPRGGAEAGRGAGARGGLRERLRRMDADRDGIVTREEFTGPQRFFDRLDADGGGTITADEVERLAGRGAAAGRRPGLEPGAVDADKDNRVSKPELDAWFEKADENGDGFVDGPEWAAAVSGRALSDPAPLVGAPAPKVSAARMGRKETVDLGAVERITVLIFGSHT